ncbi:RNase A-like domain-containing protein [Kineosporia sp. R_H_3]|uniref:RNase A-like domain-containing protein n=1 Tax=Kineosporia sp. R_H_3 TaxID=1961848 RepID=UPI000B4A9597|nr:RNase A-like domain-containing protein [Kineosporia sp. R_H_3]
MIKMPTDADGLVVPAADPEAAWDAASGLTSVARSALAAVDALSGTPASAVCWSGDAADGYRRVRERMARRSNEIAELASAGATVVLGWLREAGPALVAMRSVAARMTDLQRRVDAAAALAYDPVLDAALQAEVDETYRQWHVARDTYWQAVEVAARRLVALRDVVVDRPLDGQDQVEGALQAVWDGYVAGPAAATWALTGLAFVDRDRWWDNVSGLPGATADTLGAVADDPLGALADVADVDAWESGHYGEAAGGLAAMFLPGPRWLGLGEDVGRLRFAKNIADPKAPKPQLQTVDEMLAGVDLARHEHYEYGHALRRHVDVDDDYLMDRLTHGTLLDGDEGRGGKPQGVSRFRDRATAERVVTEALLLHETDLRGLAHQPVGSRLQITYTSHSDIGEIMRRQDGGFEVDAGRRLALSVINGPQGPYIETAFVVGEAS